MHREAFRLSARRCDRPKKLEQTTKELADLNDRYMKIFFKPKKLNTSSRKAFRLAPALPPLTKPLIRCSYSAFQPPTQ